MSMFLGCLLMSSSFISDRVIDAWILTPFFEADYFYVVASGQFEITVSDAEENEKEEGQPQEEAEKSTPQRPGRRDIKGGHLAECDCRMLFHLVL